jgi:hypothetical protein
LALCPRQPRLVGEGKTVKKVVTIVLVVVSVFVGKSYLDAKMSESDRNHEVTQEFLLKVCGGDAHCRERMDLFNPCFAGAYRRSPFKGKDRINLDVLIDCMNGDIARDVFVVGEGTPVPFPVE